MTDDIAAKLDALLAQQEETQRLLRALLGGAVEETWEQEFADLLRTRPLSEITVKDRNAVRGHFFEITALIAELASLAHTLVTQIRAEMPEREDGPLGATREDAP